MVSAEVDLGSEVSVMAVVEDGIALAVMASEHACEDLRLVEGLAGVEDGFVDVVLVVEEAEAWVGVGKVVAAADSGHIVLEL